MITKYNTEINNEAIIVNLNRLTNQIYKLLPMREEGGDWLYSLRMIVEEVAGIAELLFGQHTLFLKLLSKLEGLTSLTADDDFMVYRSVIFETLGLIDEVKTYVRSR